MNLSKIVGCLIDLSWTILFAKTDPGRNISQKNAKHHSCFAWRSRTYFRSFAVSAAWSWESPIWALKTLMSPSIWVWSCLKVASATAFASSCALASFSSLWLAWICATCVLQASSDYPSLPKEIHVSLQIALKKGRTHGIMWKYNKTCSAKRKLLTWRKYARIYVWILELCRSWRNRNMLE